MFHLAANFVALANVANTEVPALQDDVLQLRSARHTPSEDLFLFGGYASAVTLVRSRLNAPTTRLVAPSFLIPVQTTLLPPTDPNFMDVRQNPFRLKKDEGIIWESTDSAAGPNNHYILSVLSPRLDPAPVGDMYTIRGTSTTAAVASTWTTITVTWDSDLPQGIYAVVGGMYIATNAIAFSCIFEGQYWRPGGLGSANAGVRPYAAFLKGGFGKWGQFRSLNPPGIRVLNDGTDAVHTLFLDVVKVA